MTDIQPERVIFTVPELLKWAHEETKMADVLETFNVGMKSPEVEEEITNCRLRSRWLDQQVAYYLDTLDEKKDSEP